MVALDPGKEEPFEFSVQESVQARGFPVKDRYHRYLRLAMQGYISRTGEQPVENVLTTTTPPWIINVKKK